MNATLFLDAALDALLDSLRMLPFLFVAFLILEALEHYSSNRLTHFFQHKKGGPAIASLLGCIPQCGFSTLISSLYCGGIVTVGTLIAVYLSTSDEAILILLAHPDRAGVVGKLLLAKLIIAIPAGYLVDFIWNRWRHPQKHVEDLCDHCGCHDHHGIIRPGTESHVKAFCFYPCVQCRSESSARRDRAGITLESPAWWDCLPAVSDCTAWADSELCSFYPGSRSSSWKVRSVLVLPLPVCAPVPGLDL